MTAVNNEDDPRPPGALPREATTHDARTLTLRVEPTIDLAVGLTLAMRREMKGLSIEVLADLTGLPLEELKDHESGTYPLPVSRAALLSEALGFDPSALLGAARLGHRHGMIAVIGRAPDEPPPPPPPEEDTESHDSTPKTGGGGCRGY